MQLLLMTKEIIMPFDSAEFNKAWELWKKYKKEQHKFTFKGTIAEQAQLRRLSKLSNGNEQLAIDIIEYCIEQTWKGLFLFNSPIKTQPKKELTLQQKILQGL